MGRPQVIRFDVDPETGDKRVAQDMLDRMIELGQQGKWIAHYAQEFRVAKVTIRHWRKQYPEFDEAFQIAYTAAQAWWEDLGRDHAVTKTGQTFNQTVWLRTLAAHARDEWIEVKETVTRDGDRADLLTKTDEELENEIAQIEAQRAAREAAKVAAAEARARAKARDA